MRSAPRLAALIASALLLLVLPACWPLAPIAALAAAGGGGGGGGGGAAGVVLSGTIITDASGLSSVQDVDREPNDRLGRAHPLGRFDGGRSALLEGVAGVRATAHALVAGADGVEMRVEQLLERRSRSFAVGPRESAPRAFARSGHELLMLAERDGGPELVVTPLVSPFAKRRIPLGLRVDARGMAALLDAIVILDAGAGSSRLVAFDADDGAALVIADLERDALAHLAGAVELATGRERLFTCDPAGGELLEIAIETDGGDRRFGALDSLGTLGFISGRIAALGYDGALLHVVDSAGTLHSIDPATLEPVDARPFLRPGERALAIAIALEPDLDGYHVTVAPGARLRVELAVTSSSADRGRFFLATVDRRNAIRSGTPGFDSFVPTSRSPDRVAVELAAPADAPASFDLVVGALAGIGRYRLGIGTSARAPLAGASAELDEHASALAVHLEAAVLAARTPELIAGAYLDPLLAEFVPGRLAAGRADPAAALALPPSPDGFELTRALRSPSGHDLLDVRRTAPLAGAPMRTLHGAPTRQGTRREQSRELIAVLDAIEGAPGLAWCEPDYVCRTLAFPNDFVAEQQWHLNQLNLQSAWDLTVGAFSTILAIVDTGVRTGSGDPTLDISDLEANVGSEGFDFVSGSNSGDGDGYDPDPFDQGTFAGNSHHGSHVGGTMGARGNNGNLGTGVCWNCELMPLRALGTDGAGSISDIVEAIRYAAGLVNASGTTPSQRAAAINLSLGTAGFSATLQSAVQAAVNAGCIVMCAVGNDGNNFDVLYPAAFDESIAVAASDPGANIASYSNAGPEVDITCPGGADDGNAFNDVWSTVGVGAGGSLQPLAGTSMACAHATGVAGLLATQFPGITRDDAMSILRCSAIDIDASGVDDFSGFGLVDAAAAVSNATARNNGFPVLDLAAIEVDFGHTGSSLVVQARNCGGGQLNIVSLPPMSLITPPGVPPTEAWLTTDVSNDGKSIELTADRAGLPAGDYQIQVDCVTNGGTAPLLVDLAVGVTSVTDVGAVLVLVVAEDRVTVVGSTTATAANGYEWSFAAIPSGSYFLICATDVDGDGLFGEASDQFGAYPRAATPELLELDVLNSLRTDLLLE